MQTTTLSSLPFNFSAQPRRKASQIVHAASSGQCFRNLLHVPHAPILHRQVTYSSSHKLFPSHSIRPAIHPVPALFRGHRPPSSLFFTRLHLSIFQYIQRFNDSNPIIITEDFMCCLPYHRPPHIPSNTRHTLR